MLTGQILHLDVPDPFVFFFQSKGREGNRGNQDLNNNKKEHNLRIMIKQRKIIKNQNNMHNEIKVNKQPGFH